MSLRVASFYKFVELSALPELRVTLRTEARRLGLLGTVLLAPEGLNASLFGEETSLLAFVAWLGTDPRFAGLAPKLSEARGQPFRRLEVKLKRWIIRFAEEGDPGVAEVQAGQRLAPAELRALLAEPRDDVVLVDTRNDYETDFGSFRGAVRLPVRTFTEFPAAFTERFGDAKDKTFVFFCTGGVRCEKVVPWAAARGYQHATQLDGGILAYFEQHGAEGFDGECFVFDTRWLVDGGLSEVGLSQPPSPPKPPRRTGR